MKSIFVSFFLCLALLGVCYSQDKTSKTLQEVIDKHIKQLKETLTTQKAKIYIIVNFDTGFFKDRENVFYVLPHLHSQFFKKDNEDSFLVEFIVSDDLAGIKIKAVNSRIIRKGKKNLELTNLGNGQTYILNH
jgi:hypothetical protein